MTVADTLRIQDRTTIADRESTPVVEVRPAWQERLGWLPVLTVIMGGGLVGLAVALNGARAGATWASTAFWIGLLVILIPAAIRLFLPGVARAERLGIVVTLGFALYLAAVLHDPIQLLGYDDNLNLRTLLDILNQNRLFTENPLLLVNSFYPALGSTAAALSDVTGLDPFTSIVVVMGVLRILLILALFLFFENVSGSAWVGALASLLYMTNPDFVFFNSAYVYESFALPFAIVTLWLVSERQLATNRVVRVGLTIVTLVAIACVVMGHHLTTMALAGALVVWTLTTFYRRVRGDDTSHVQGVGGIAAITIVAGFLWTAYVANEMVKYLGSLFVTTLQGAIRFLSGGPGRILFQESGSASPPEERAVALAATAIVVILLPIGLVVLWRTLGRRPAALMLAIVALGYPTTQILRLTSSGGLEVASRANSYVFVGVAFAIALLGVRVLDGTSFGRRALAGIAAVLVAVLFTGGIVLGSAWWSRLPGPYIVGGDARSISPEGTSAATWMLDQLGSDQRVAADRANRLLLGSTGMQRVVYDARDPVALLPLFADPTVDGPAEFVLKDQKIRYVLVDRRLSEAVPLVGLYYDQDEQRHPWTQPIPASSLAKFDGDRRFQRIYDNGVIQIYDAQSILP
jgi:hypothetical protein